MNTSASATASRQLLRQKVEAAAWLHATAYVYVSSLQSLRLEVGGFAGGDDNPTHDG